MSEQFRTVSDMNIPDRARAATDKNRRIEEKRAIEVMQKSARLKERKECKSL
jgi:hypothetical protein